MKSQSESNTRVEHSFRGSCQVQFIFCTCVWYGIAQCTRSGSGVQSASCILQGRRRPGRGEIHDALRIDVLKGKLVAANIDIDVDADVGRRRRNFDVHPMRWFGSRLESIKRTYIPSQRGLCPSPIHRRIRQIYVHIEPALQVREAKRDR